MFCGRSVAGEKVGVVESNMPSPGRRGVGAGWRQGSGDGARLNRDGRAGRIGQSLSVFSLAP